MMKNKKKTAVVSAFGLSATVQPQLYHILPIIINTNNSNNIYNATTTTNNNNNNNIINLIQVTECFKFVKIKI